jgi:hypothetical protein
VGEIKVELWAGGVAQVVECQREALSSTPVPPKKKKKKKRIIVQMGDA